MDVLATEEQQVEAWVLDQLLREGFDGDQTARLLAASVHDPEAWRRAVAYVRDGCRHDLAVRIVC